jgi:hypothetical protein
VAFFRFSRDKRGYEHFYLVESVTSRKGKSRSRVLYWYRTPPNVKVGREPFDEEVRRQLEAQYPSVTFDWAKILETPIPSADADKWRERRRAERADRAARRSRPSDPEATDDEMLEEDPDAAGVGVSDAEHQPDSAAVDDAEQAPPSGGDAGSAAHEAGKAGDLGDGEDVARAAGSAEPDPLNERPVDAGMRAEAAAAPPPEREPFTGE